MRIFATKEIECGGQVRPFKVNLFATAQFCEAKGIRIAELADRLGNPSLIDMMDFAYYAHLATGSKVDRDEFMTWFDDSNLFEEFTELVTSALSGESKQSVGKQKNSTGAKLSVSESNPG
jgi:hypothetical protein